MRWSAMKGPVWVLELTREPILLAIRCINACSVLSELWSALFLIGFGFRSIAWGWVLLREHYPQVHASLTRFMPLEWLSWALIVLGLFQLTALFLNSFSLRKLAAFMSFHAWLILTILFVSPLDWRLPLVAIAFPPASICTMLAFISLSLKQESCGRHP